MRSITTGTATPTPTLTAILGGLDESWETTVGLEAANEDENEIGDAVTDICEAVLDVLVEEDVDVDDVSEVEEEVGATIPMVVMTEVPPVITLTLTPV